MVLAFLSAPVWSDECGAPHTPVAEVQGHGERSPLAGQRVAVEGVVTLDLRQPGGFYGFYLQQALAEQDDSATTSEGLFIHTRAGSGKPGDRVRVQGNVEEYHGLTSLTDVAVITVCSEPGLPIPQPLQPDQISPIERETLEGMLVQTQEPLVITDAWNLARYGELALSPTLQWAPTQVMAPGPETRKLFQQQALQRLILDDGYRRQNPRPIPYLYDSPLPGNPLRIGDRIGPITGILDFRFGHWRLQPLKAPDIHYTNPRGMPPERHPESNLRVVSLNLGNLFNGDGQGNSFPTARGARTEQDYQHQLERVTRQIKAIDPDILAVSELENDGYDKHSSLAQVAQALGEHWRFVEGRTDRHEDAIRNALLYRSDVVTPMGPAILISEQAFARWHRPPLAQTFRHNAADRPLTVVSVHLKSKSCRGAPSGQKDNEDGQACFARARENATGQLAAWRPSESNDNPPILLTGDFNAYAHETAIQRLIDGGYTDLIAQAHGYKQQTFRYHGRQGTLDYHLANAALAKHVTASHIWSVNAEEPRVLAYDADLPPEMPSTFLWRASDHNPVITDLRL